MQSFLESIGLADTSENRLYVNSAVAWINKNTTYSFEKACIDIPDECKLFIVKYSQLMSTQAGVASESISGMSQSFVTGQKLENSIYELAVALFGKDAIKMSNVTVFSGEGKWDYGG